MPTLHLPQLEDLRVASPCHASWDAMTGTDRVRHCGDCDKRVYNIAEMTREEAHTLIRTTEGRLCVRMYRRSDGTILTADCPVGFAKVRERTARLVGRVAAGLAFMLAATPAIFGRDRGSAALADRQPFRSLIAWISPTPIVKPPIMGAMIMGDVAMPPKPAPAPAPTPAPATP